MKVWLWAMALFSLVLATAFWLTVSGTPLPTPGRQVTSRAQEPVIQGLANRPGVKPKVIVPILMYHYIRDYQNPDDYLGIQLSVSPKTFERQLQTLTAAGYYSISLEAFAEGKVSPPPKSSATKPIILTFDDGYESHYTEALPILQKFGLTGTFFIVSGFVNRPFYVTHEQIRQLSIGQMELGGHTIHHKNLATLGYEAQIEEISDGQKSRASVFAYPAGKYLPITLDILQGLGVKAAVTTDFGLATDLSERLELPRIRVKETTDLIKIFNEETRKLNSST